MITEANIDIKPKECPYCKARRINRPDMQWQYDCKDIPACMKQFDIEASEFLRNKYL